MSVSFTRELFLKHDVYHDLAVCLIHRHFDMTDNEKLVEYGAVSTPWSYTQADNNMMGRITVAVIVHSSNCSVLGSFAIEEILLGK